VPDGTDLPTRAPLSERLANVMNRMKSALGGAARSRTRQGEQHIIKRGVRPRQSAAAAANLDKVTHLPNPDDEVYGAAAA
jgi:hypothetical protein